MGKKIGIIYAHGFKNGCCEDKPFILEVNNDKYYACACECNCWCTTGWKTPAEAIMEYELMCRHKLNEFGDPKVYEKYKKARGVK